MADDNVTFELKEPAAPEALLPPDYTQAGWLAAALVALVLLAAWLIHRLRRRPANTPLSRRNLAYKEATGALGRVAAANARAAAVQTSLILRKYLSLAAEDPALFETHEEFIARNDALQSLTETARAACAAGFARLAACKYAPAIPDLTPAAVVGDARELLETLHHGFRA
ncbi:MAG: hypothetical protein WCK77_05960 [Verrucomicrobiota bacterium]